MPILKNVKVVKLDSETKETLAKSKDLPSNKYTLELNSSWISIFLVT